MTAPLRVYVNGRGVDVPQGATLLDAIRAFDETVASAIVTGDRALADSRGLPIEADSLAFTGAIVRVVSGRRSRTDDHA